MVDAFHLVFTDEDKKGEVEADTFGFSIHYFLHKTLKTLATGALDRLQVESLVVRPTYHCKSRNASARQGLRGINTYTFEDT
jgi:hypothetical protein